MVASRPVQSRTLQAFFAFVVALFVGVAIYLVWPRTYTVETVDEDAGMFCDVVSIRQACLKDYTYNVQNKQYFGAIRQSVDPEMRGFVAGGEVDFKQQTAANFSIVSALGVFAVLYWFKESLTKKLSVNMFRKQKNKQKTRK